ncbi:TMPIT-like protein-domain-containing protein [Blyttiomyces helicus]|uniref:TMPIT-like protein-domain-containing protein n=1 Tax=Blyttiomyces helicus TaxID=388810 RepID=A0A4P9VWI1_9FUNG|nr:TMPIT-like protein-domain-containing protein [Blyttiomyces helicus]|eukprot:RKO84061.1 TMPIT-like protein-domain-containing protein [Blyttiomyces helicus]
MSDSTPTEDVVALMATLKSLERAHPAGQRVQDKELVVWASLYQHHHERDYAGTCGQMTQGARRGWAYRILTPASPHPKVWPTTASYTQFRAPFFKFAIYITVVQTLQYRYQQARLYVLVSLDRAVPMDTLAGDGFFTNSLEREFWLLTPFLVIGQLWQFWIGGRLWYLYSRGVHEEWQVS